MLSFYYCIISLFDTHTRDTTIPHINLQIGNWIDISNLNRKNRVRSDRVITFFFALLAATDRD